ncbi:hypothetical protein TYRP_001657 [Tyrophagus putrescentiae]|nr:hypothetical protein TYRP_001657 [Tyrophagus putrescentiae]
MARLGALYVFSYVFSFLTIVDSAFYLTMASSPSSPTSYIIGNASTSVYLAMSFRIAFSLLFFLGAIFLDGRPKVLVPLMGALTVATFGLLVGCSCLLRFRLLVLSLYLHVLMLFFNTMCFLDELRSMYGLRTEAGQTAAVSAAEAEATAAANNNAASQMGNSSGGGGGGQNRPVNRALRLLDSNMLAISTLSAVAVAIIVGMLIRAHDPLWTARQLMYAGYFGELFLRILKCLILPLIFCSLVFAIGNIDASLSGRIAMRTVIFYFGTTFFAILIGIVLVILIAPGTRGKIDGVITETVTAKAVTTMDTILDLVRNVFPANIFEACFAFYSTELSCNEATLVCDDLLDSSNCTCKDIGMDNWKITGVMDHKGGNILGIVMFAIVFGVMITRIEKREQMVSFFCSLNDIMMAMTTAVIGLTPLAVVFLILPQIIKVKDLSVMFGSIGFYAVTVLGGIAVQGLVTLPGLYFALTRRNPFRLIRQMLPAMATAFGTSSSSATMPVTFNCLEEGAGLDKRIVRFCIPVGSTINMDGTALYEAVAAIFIAQYRNIPLDLVKIIIITITATAASIGAAGIPQAGLVTMIIVLNAVGLPAEDAALIVVVDWLLDRFRTMLNVLGDAFGSAIVDHLSRDEIEELDRIPAIAPGHGIELVQLPSGEEIENTRV